MTDAATNADRTTYPIYCAFCGCDQDRAVVMIVAQVRTAICDACVSTCVEIMVNQQRKKAELPLVKFPPVAEKAR